MWVPMDALTSYLTKCITGQYTDKAAGCRSLVAIRNSATIAGLFSCRGKSFEWDQVAALMRASCSHAIQLLFTHLLMTKLAACMYCKASALRVMGFMVSLKAPVGSAMDTDKFSTVVLSSLVEQVEQVLAAAARLISSKDLFLNLL